MPQAYAAAARFWVYPIFLIIVIGTWRSHRRRMEERRQPAST
jgi:cytochrome c-type biogenesis protein CcmH/NrfF